MARPDGHRSTRVMIGQRIKPGTIPPDRLMALGGWSSPAMPLRYIESAHIANEGTARVK
jgi:hypothetical protein